jgi:Rrf2 family protein
VRSAFKISEAAGLAIHAVTLIVRDQNGVPLKLSRLAQQLSASEAHLGKVMHRLALSQIVTSKRGPTGGFVVGPKAAKSTLLDLYEMFDGPLGDTHCLLGYKNCPFGKCAFGDAIAVVNQHLRETLGKKKLTDLTD